MGKHTWLEWWLKTSGGDGQAHMTGMGVKKNIHVVESLKDSFWVPTEDSNITKCTPFNKFLYTVKKHVDYMLDKFTDVCD